MGNRNCTRKNLRLAPSGSRSWYGNYLALKQNKNNMLRRVTASVSGNLRVVWNGFPIITWGEGVVWTSSGCCTVSGKTGTIFEVSGRETKTTALLKHVKSSF
jgi:hypothetical protein